MIVLPMPKELDTLPTHSDVGVKMSNVQDWTVNGDYFSVNPPLVIPDSAYCDRPQSHVSGHFYRKKERKPMMKVAPVIIKKDQMISEGLTITL